MVKRCHRVVWFVLMVTSLSIGTTVGGYSTQAIALRDTVRDKPRKIFAPLGSASVSAEFIPTRNGNGELQLVVSHSGTRNTLRGGIGIGAELLWAPDGKGFSLTTSNQGANGIYKAYVYRIVGAQVEKINLTPPVEKLFGHPAKCGWPEPPNVAVVGWGKSSNRILVVAEIIHHSVCDSYGTFKLYELELPSLKLVRVYDQLAAKKKFAPLLGRELMQANDECIKTRRLCFVPTNHQ